MEWKVLCNKEIRSDYCTCWSWADIWSLWLSATENFGMTYLRIVLEQSKISLAKWQTQSNKQLTIVDGWIRSNFHGMSRSMLQMISPSREHLQVTLTLSPSVKMLQHIRMLQTTMKPLKDCTQSSNHPEHCRWSRRMQPCILPQVLSSYRRELQNPHRKYREIFDVNFDLSFLAWEGTRMSIQHDTFNQQKQSYC